MAAETSFDKNTAIEAVERFLRRYSYLDSSDRAVLLLYLANNCELDDVWKFQKETWTVFGKTLLRRRLETGKIKKPKKELLEQIRFSQYKQTLGKQ